MATLRNPVDDHDFAQGPADAQVTLVEYGDYECPYCGAAYPVVKQLQAQFGDRLRLAFRNFPLVQAHPHALEAACTAVFAGEHGRFWEMHDALFELQTHLGRPLYAALATRFGLEADALEQTLDSERLAARVRDEFNGGVRSGVNGTPTFFINGVRYEGDYMHLGRELAAILR
jgi:protein-disulfide isomerase